MKWYVLNYDFNGKKIELFNIFGSCRFSEGVEKLLKKYTTFEDFVKELDSLAMYCFWCKREYEIMCCDLFVNEPDKLEKIDVYFQLKNNIEVLAKYIILEYNKGKRKKIEIK